MTNQQRRLRLLIVQKNAILRLGLRSVLERHEMQIIGEMIQRDEILEMVASQHPDVVLIDGNITFCDSYCSYSAAQMVKHIRRASSCGIFVMVPEANEESLFQFMLGGAAAYELNTLGCNALVEKVQRVAAGEYLITDEVLQPVKQQLTRLPQRAQRPRPEKRIMQQARRQNQERLGVTNREIEVLQCAMHGLSNAQIGRVLGITDQTAKNHMTHLLSKLSVRGRTGAVVAALRYGLITCSDMLPEKPVQPTSQITPLREMPEAQHNGVISHTVTPRREGVAV